MKIVPVIAILLFVSSGSARGAEQHTKGNEDLPHSFLLPKSIPDEVGSFHAQLTPFIERRNSVTTADLGGHLSFGMYEWGGLHVRSLGVKTSPSTELITMVNLYRDAAGRGISALGIVGITKARPGDEHNHGLNYLVGLTGRPLASRASILDMNVHYDFSANHLISEAGFVRNLSGAVFGTLDVRGTIGEVTEFDLLSGLKYRVFEVGFIGVGYRFPLTTAKLFDSQVLLQLEIARH